MTGSVETPINPYIGPRAFEEDEHELFYGREEEIAILEGLVLSRRAVLFFAQSGAGKSSLLKAGLVPELTRQETIGRGRFAHTTQKMRVLPVLSVGGAIPANLEAQVENVFVFSALFSLHPDSDPAEIAGLSFMEGLAPYFQKPGEEGEAGSSASQSDSNTLLIFDQFEELFTHHLERWQEREDFFQQVSQAMEAYPNLHMLFSMREDHIAELTPYAHLLPEQLRPRFRMERLKREAALQAVIEPAKKGGRTFAEGVAEALVDNLRRTQPGRENARQAGSEAAEQASLGEYVEPVHLQLVCRQLWQKLPAERSVIEAGDVQDFGDVDKALTDFYEATLATVLSQTSLSERGLRTWFDRKLITPARTRGLVYRDETETEGLPNIAVDILNEAYIIRASTRGRDIWYELAHDRLVEPILASNRAWMENYHNPLTSATRAWMEAGRDPNKLLKGEPLTAAEEYAAKYPADLLAEEKEFLAKSRQTVQQRSARRRILALIALAAILVLSSLTFWALRERYRAFQNEIIAAGNAQTAAANRATAVFAESAAEAAQATARAERRLAEESESTAAVLLDGARAAQSTALAALRTAEAGRNLADGRRLAAQGRGLLDADIRLAAQLAVESEATSPAWESSSLLLDLALRTSKQTIQEYGRPIPAAARLIFGAALSPNGRHLAWGTQDGHLEVWNYLTQRPVWEDADAHRGSVRSVAFSPDGSLLASGGGQPFMFIWNADNGEIVKRFDDRSVINNQVLSLAFDPQRPRLAAVNLNQIVIIDTDTWAEIRRTEAEPADILDLAWSPDGSLLASGEDADGNGVAVWDPETGKKVLAFPITVATRSVAWSADGNVLAAGSDDGVTRFWNIQTGLEIPGPIIPDTNQPVWAVAFSPDGKMFVRGGQDERIAVFATLDYERVGDIENGDRGFIRAVEFSPAEGSNLLVAVNEKVPTGPYSVSLYEIEGDHPLVSAQLGGGDSVRALAAQPGGAMLLIRAASGTTRVRQASGVAEGVAPVETSLYEPQGDFNAWAVAPDGERLALGEHGGPVIIEALPSGEILQSLPLEDQAVRSLAFSWDGQVLATGFCVASNEAGSCSQGGIQLWEASSGRVLNPAPLAGEQASITALAFNREGTTLASGSQDGSIQLWDLATYTSAGPPLTRHKREVTSLAFSADGKRLASGSRDNALLLWDTESRQPLGSPLLGPVRVTPRQTPGELVAAGGDPLLAAQSGVAALTFRDEGLLLAGYADGRVLEWDVGLERWIEIACRLAGESLSEEEQGLYFPDGGYQDVCGK